MGERLQASPGGQAAKLICGGGSDGAEVATEAHVLDSDGAGNGERGSRRPGRL